jgi:hypothetical protein
MLEFDDIQHILLTRVPALTGRYEFLSLHNPAGGRAWLSAILARVQSAAEVRASTEIDNRWVSVANRASHPTFATKSAMAEAQADGRGDRFLG